MRNCVWFGLVAVGLSPCFGQEGVAWLRFFDGLGGEVPALVELQQAGRPALRFTTQEGGSRVSLPPGEYNVTASVIGFRNFHDTIYVEKGETTLLLGGLCVAGQEVAALPVVHGAVAGLPKGKNAEVHLIGVYNNDRRTVLTDATGSFVTPYRCEGAYVAVVAVDGKVVETTDVQLFKDREELRLRIR